LKGFHFISGDFFDLQGTKQTPEIKM